LVGYSCACALAETANATATATNRKHTRIRADNVEGEAGAINGS